ncbi:MAG: pyruvate:ferredoxin (flavodoxin) oxidoreductase, partial [Opitutales bacterium]|nr:pyruvate:ferredoxin (flavodoxin) oxidoreductase [Opitutales bacterium]
MTDLVIGRLRLKIFRIKMTKQNFDISDANEAVADIAYRLSEIIAIYPITPSSAMAEHCDEWASQNRKNLFDIIPTVEEMQSEGGAAGAIHGALVGGMLATTFTASQGLLLMIPNMYKIAGELLPFVMHVTARSLATHALSIFGDHSDVMACRQTGFAMLVSNSVQEAHDMACIAHAATLESRIPFIHFFDGFRTSHEINCFKRIEDDVLHSIIDKNAIVEHHNRGLSPDSPNIHGTAQNPDVYFQCRERANIVYEHSFEIVTNCMARFKKLTGREYHLFEYVGAPDADRVIIAMGSACETIEKTVHFLNLHGEKVGLVKIHLYRPFSVEHFLNVLPKSVRSIAVLDRTKEPGSIGEPLFLDVVAAIAQDRAKEIDIIGGRYGLGSKEFSPAMVKAIFEELGKTNPKKHFTIGIEDDVSHTSLQYDHEFNLEDDETFQAVFYGLGSDGTVGANKNTVKIIGAETDNYVQAYFVYDSKKSGAMTVSHLRFGKSPIKAPYLITHADFIACHQFSFINTLDILNALKPHGTFLLNSRYDVDSIWDHLPYEAQKQILDKKVSFYVIDAYEVARKCNIGGRINTIMQTCFFAISGILPKEEAIEKIKEAIKKTYGKKGQKVVEQNYAAVDATLEHLHLISIDKALNGHKRKNIVPSDAPDFVRDVTAQILSNKGDSLPVSAFPLDGVWPTATSQYEKRNIATEIPEWSPDLCIQCNKCVSVCPHAAIRSKFYDQSDANPAGFQCADFRSRDFVEKKFTVQVSPEDCTGCGLCATVCPGKSRTEPAKKALMMKQSKDIFEQTKKNYEFFQTIPYANPEILGEDFKSVQFKQPLFEFSGACAGCGEASYIRLITQLFGDRAIIANATGCSSIYGGNLPTTPYCKNADGRGPAWANSLFEDNAEFGLGLRLSINKRKELATELLKRHSSELGSDLIDNLLVNCHTESERQKQRKYILELKNKLSSASDLESKLLYTLS